MGDDDAPESLQRVQTSLEEWERQARIRFDALEGKDSRERAADGFWQVHRHPANVLVARAEAHPDAPALEYWPSIDEACSYRASYAQFLRNVRIVALHLNNFGAVDGLNIAVTYMARGPELTTAMWGCFYAGVPVTSLDRSYPVERLKFTLEDTQAAVLLTLSKEENFDTTVGVNILPVRDTLAKPDQKVSRPLAPSPRNDSDLCGIIYTSGSTGKPKGVELLLGGFSNYCCIDQHLVDLQTWDKTLQTQSLSFVAGYMETFRPFVAGATLVVGGDSIGRAGPDLLPWVDNVGVTFFKCVPSLLRAVAGQDQSPYIPPKLRVLISSGEALCQDMMKRVYQGADAHRPRSMPPLVILNTYGPTELNANCSVAIPKPLDSKVTIGFPYPTYKLYCLDDKNQVCSKGELCVSGMSLARGYLGRPEATAQAFFEHPDLGRLYRTGDVAAKEPSGEFSFAGRIAASTQVKINGYRVELGEVEFHLRKIPQVFDAMALHVDDKLVALVCPRKGCEVTLRQLRDVLFQSGLQPHALPSQLTIVAEMPTTISGKLDRNAAKAIVQADTQNTASAKGQREPTTLEDKICYAMSVALGLGSWESVHADDDFFILGGTSVTVAALVNELRKTPELAGVSVRDVFDGATPQRLAASVRPGKEGGAGKAATPSCQVGSMASPHGDDELHGGSYPTLFTSIQAVYICMMLMVDAVRTVLSWNIGGVGMALYQVIDGTRWNGRFVLVVLCLPAARMITALVLNILLAVYLVVLKKILIGRYTEGRYALYGTCHLAHWMVQHTARHCDLPGSFLGPILRRMLGAKVDSSAIVNQCSFSCWDLVTIGSNASCCHCHMTPVSYDTEAVTFGRIVVGDDAVVRPRATVVGPAELHSGSTLDYMSSLSNASIPVDEMWRGSPAEPVGSVMTSGNDSDQPMLENAMPLYTVLLDSAKTLTLYFIDIVGIIPSIVIWNTFTHLRYINRWPIVLPINIAMHSVTLIVACAMVCRLMATGPKVGRFHWTSMAAFRAEYAAWAFSMPMGMLNNTWLQCSFMRAAGCKLGEKANMAKLSAAVPWLVDIGPECFFANWVHAGFATFERGVMELRPFCTGRECFFGNRSLLPPGTALPPKSLGGVLSVPPADYRADVHFEHDLEDPIQRVSAYGDDASANLVQNATNRSSDRSCARLLPHMPAVQYMGNPPMRLRLTQMDSVPEPTTWQLLRHKFADVVVVMLPQVFRCAPQLAWLIIILRFSFIEEGHTRHLMYRDANLFFICSMLHALCRLGCAFAFGNIARLVRGGKIVPSEYDYWSSYVDWWHLCNKIMNVNVNRQLLVPFVGSRLLNHVLPLVSSAKVHSTALIVGAGAFREHDLVEIGKNSVINECVVFRTHTFEGWKLQFERVTIHKDVVVGCNSELMSGCRLESGCFVGINTIVYKAGVVPPGAIFAGLPGEVLGQVEREESDSPSSSGGSGISDGFSPLRALELLSERFLAKKLLPVALE